jgi:ubiquinone/menaquinone biosynthesis C-methylase UbiE
MTKPLSEDPVTSSPSTTAPPNTAEIYEKLLVHFLFRPWAEEVIGRAGLVPGKRVLDVACGTGIVARLALDRVGESGSVAGVDLSPIMLGVARRLAPGIDFRAGNAMSLPVGETESFDVVICHQGLQFVPDRLAAAREMRRVLAPGGKAVAAVWGSDQNHLFLSGLRRSAEKHVGPVNDLRHGFADAAALGRLFEDAGFTDVRVEEVVRTLHCDDPQSFVRMNAMALVGMSARGKEISEDERAALVQNILRDSDALVRSHSDAQGLHYDITSNIVVAS